MFPTKVVILAGARTPMARYNGAFQDTSALDLGAAASREAIRRAGVDPAEFDHSIFGNVLQTSSDALYGARHVALKAGLKIETPATGRADARANGSSGSERGLRGSVSCSGKSAWSQP